MWVPNSQFLEYANKAYTVVKILLSLLVGPTQLAQQNTNANAGAGGTAIGSGDATANMAGPTGPCYAGLPSYPGCLYGGSNTAQQTTNANAGAGGTAIAGGSATANYQGCKCHVFILSVKT